MLMSSTARRKTRRVASVSISRRRYTTRTNELVASHVKASCERSGKQQSGRHGHVLAQEQKRSRGRSNLICIAISQIYTLMQPLPFAMRSFL